MLESHFLILLIAMLLDWRFGEPQIIWSRLPHPVVLFGKTISLADKLLNRRDDAAIIQYRKGGFAIAICLLVALVAGLALERLFSIFGPRSMLFEIVVVFVLLAQKSLYDHVNDVKLAFEINGLEGACKAVSLVVGRNPEVLDQSGVSRASIETLAENFSDGVVAPAFWYLVFGLPGIIVYKMINTADSMIGYRNEIYLHFGRSAARIDDLANWIPARLSAIIIALGCLISKGVAAANNSISTALRDHGLHRSPNAGWPESAMAGALNIALGGPRVYPGETVAQAFINGSGKHEIGPGEIGQALDLFYFSCLVCWILTGVTWVTLAV